jgi:hypothetical protein
MSFNHRLVKHDIDQSIGVYEVFYNEDGTIKNHSEKPIIVGNDLEDLTKEIAHINDAFFKPTLTMNALGEIEEKK